MKTKSMASCWLLSAAFIAGLSVGLSAAEKTEEKTESVTVQHKVVIALIEGKPVEATNEIQFPKDILIGTNGVFTVAKGKERILREGEVLNREGMLTRPDGSVVPVEDHLIVRSGRVWFVKDGEPQAVTSPFPLKNGSTVHPDGRMVSARNAVRRLLDGQIIRPDQGNVEATDTAQLEQGKVVLYKDGGRIVLRPGQVMAMNDGSRVDATGVIVRKDGARVVLKEGDLLKFSGAGDGR